MGACFSRRVNKKTKNSETMLIWQLTPGFEPLLVNDSIVEGSQTSKLPLDRLGNLGKAYFYFEPNQNDLIAANIKRNLFADALFKTFGARPANYRPEFGYRGVCFLYLTDTERVDHLFVDCYLNFKNYKRVWGV